MVTKRVTVTVEVEKEDGSVETMKHSFAPPGGFAEGDWAILQRRPLEPVYRHACGPPSHFKQTGPLRFTLDIQDRTNEGKTLPRGGLEDR